MKKMAQWLNKMLDKISEYLSTRKGLLPVIGMLLIISNFILQFFSLGWFTQSNLLLHLGLVIAIFGMMMAWIL
jgi:hypothetical protein